MYKKTTVITLLTLVVALLITGTTFAGATGARSASIVEPVSFSAETDSLPSFWPGDPISLAPSCSIREEKDIYEVSCTDEDQDISEVEVTFEVRRLPADIDFDTGKASIRIDVSVIRESSRTGSEIPWFTWTVADEAGHIVSGSFTG